MSQSNVLDVFLSVKIAPDTKTRLDDIRDVMDEIVNNQDSFEQLEDTMKRIGIGGGGMNYETTQLLLRSNEPSTLLKVIGRKFSKEEIASPHKIKLGNLADEWGMTETGVQNKLLEMFEDLQVRMIKSIAAGTTNTSDFAKDFSFFQSMINTSVSASDVKSFIKQSFIGKEDPAQRAIMGDLAGAGETVTFFGEGDDEIGGVAAFKHGLKAPVRPGGKRGKILEKDPRMDPIIDEYQAAGSNSDNFWNIGQEDLYNLQRSILEEKLDLTYIMDIIDRNMKKGEGEDEIAHFGLNNIINTAFPDKVWDEMKKNPDFYFGGEDTPYARMVIDGLTSARPDNQLFLSGKENLDAFIKKVRESSGSKNYAEGVRAKFEKFYKENEGYDGPAFLTEAFKTSDPTNVVKRAEELRSPNRSQTMISVIGDTLKNMLAAAPNKDKRDILRFDKLNEANKIIERKIMDLGKDGVTSKDMSEFRYEVSGITSRAVTEVLNLRNDMKNKRRTYDFD